MRCLQELPLSRGFSIGGARSLSSPTLDGIVVLPNLTSEAAAPPLKNERVVRVSLLSTLPSLTHTTPLRFASPLRKVTVGFHNSAAAMPAPFMAIVEPRLMMRVPLETTWPRAFVALAGCIETYVAGRGFVPDLLRCVLCAVCLGWPPPVCIYLYLK